MNITQAAAGLRAGKFSAVELAAEAIAKIERYDTELRTFITLTTEQALEEARQADRELAEGHDRGPLHGIPVALKDLICTKGVRTTGGSKIYAGFVPEMDAAVVERLRAAGAVMLGKLNMHELAYGITSANPHFGAVRNPWNTEHSPGGSSGGSGAAVATGMVFMAMGSDTGGSIRIPASFCGTVGLKPTYGRVSRYGVLPLGYSLDHMGPLTRTVRDAAITLNAIAGYDARDPGSSHRAAVDFVPEEGCSLRGVRIGVPENFFFEYLQEEVESAVRGALATAEKLGAVLKPVRVPDMLALNAIARVVLLSEASAVGAAFTERRDDLGTDVRALMDQGLLIAAADYVNAQRLRRRMRSDFAKLWVDVDCIVAPSTPNVAPRIGATTIHLGGREEDVRLATTRLARGVNALGFPALSLPCGLSSKGLPIGLQVIGAAFDESGILRVCAALEEAGVGIPPVPWG